MSPARCIRDFQFDLFTARLSYYSDMLTVRKFERCRIITWCIALRGLVNIDEALVVGIVLAFNEYLRRFPAIMALIQQVTSQELF
ncbi:MAG: hypothetical protein ACLQBQ_12625 [Smithella sp.]